MKLGIDTNTIWIAGAPNMGATWIYDVTCSVVASANLKVAPKPTELFTEKELINIGVEAINDTRKNIVYILEAHWRLSARFHKSVFIVPRRDVHDYTACYMKFSQFSFDDACRASEVALAIEKHYAALSPERVLFIDYADMLARSTDVVAMIAGFLRIRLDRHNAGLIALANGADKVLGGPGAPKKATDYTPGDWRTILTVAQQDRLRTRIIQLQ